MRIFGLIGFPLGHSFSKKYFSEKFLREHIKDCSYENLPLPRIDLINDLISNNPDLCGLNITIPYKSAIMKYLDYIDKQALEVGAVNVLKILKKNNKTRIHGFNTDVDGFRDSVLPFLGKNTNNALVLGTGGSAKAVNYVLRNLGMKVTSVSRTKGNSELTYSDLTCETLANIHLIVNTTPLGMYPDIESKPDLNYECLNKGQILFDLVYNPELTTFLKLGKKRGCVIIGGTNMLYAQAEKAWKIWNDDLY